MWHERYIWQPRPGARCSALDDAGMRSQGEEQLKSSLPKAAVRAGQSKVRADRGPSIGGHQVQTGNTRPATVPGARPLRRSQTHRVSLFQRTQMSSVKMLEGLLEIRARTRLLPGSGRGSRSAEHRLANAGTARLERSRWVGTEHGLRPMPQPIPDRRIAMADDVRTRPVDWCRIARP
jgi:hypothetical protein